MLNINILIAITILLLLILLLIYKKKSARRETVNTVENTANITTPLGNITAPLGINNKKPEYKKLTMQERIELSWKFLYDITDIIINKFSKEDVEKIHECGHLLLNNGGKYEHVVDVGVKQAKSYTQSVEQTSKIQI